jgi:hypothetical protein
MVVEVTYDGVPLQAGAQARSENGGWFVESEQPMPVGTELRLSGDVQASVRVAEVHEGVGAGMRLVAVEAPKEIAATPAAAPEPAEPSESPSETGERSKNRRKRSKTVIGR